mmetsp:Transcript_86872/g.198318  ORF Transcript_86872/g.198318 Transcript_86872/m.198318 type:complete len:269 (-) Transcript_86872:486-1292(-)
MGEKQIRGLLISDDSPRKWGTGLRNPRAISPPSSSYPASSSPLTASRPTAPSAAAPCSRWRWLPTSVGRAKGRWVTTGLSCSTHVTRPRVQSEASSDAPRLTLAAPPVLSPQCDSGRDVVVTNCTRPRVQSEGSGDASCVLTPPAPPHPGASWPPSATVPRVARPSYATLSRCARYTTACWGTRAPDVGGLRAAGRGAGRALSNACACRNTGPGSGDGPSRASQLGAVRCSGVQGAAAPVCEVAPVLACGGGRGAASPPVSQPGRPLA